MPCVLVVAILASFWLFGQIAIAQQHSWNSTTRKPTTTVTKTLTQTRTPSSSASAVSSFSWTQGPFLMAGSSTWSQYIIPTTVGTVMVTVNEATNKTFSTTIYHTDYGINGTTALLTRTNTNAAGTVTQVVSNVTVTYPTNYFEAAASLRWSAVLPTTIDSKATCCFAQSTYSPTPTHTPFVQIGQLDEEDSRGWLYTLIGVHGEGYTEFEAPEVSSLWSNQTLSIEYGGCPYTTCNISVTDTAPASGVAAQPGHILATRTTTISSLPTSSSTSAEPASTQKAANSATSTTPQEQVSSSQSVIPENTSPISTQQSTVQSSAVISGAPLTQTHDSQVDQEPSEQASPLPVPAQSSAATPNSVRSSKIATVSETTKASTPPPDATTAPEQDSLPSKSISAPANAIVTIGSAVFTANSASRFIISDQTLALGSSLTLGSGISTTIVALQTGAPNTVLVVEDSSLALKATEAPVITIGSSTFAADSASRYVIEGQTLALGSSITIGSEASTTIIALKTSEPGPVLVIDDSSATLAQLVTPNPSVLTIGSSIFTADSATRYIIEGETLAPGSSITIGSEASTTIIALQTSEPGPVLVVEGSSATLAQPGTPTPPILTIGSSTFTADSASRYVIEGQTLALGSSITIGSGAATTVIALQTSEPGTGTVLVVGDASVTLVPPATAPLPAITIGPSVYTAGSASNYVIAGQTLAPGGPGVVVSGLTISLASGGSQLVEGTVTKTLVRPTGLGGLIFSVFDGIPAATATGTSTATETGTGGTSSSTPMIQQASGASRGDSRIAVLGLVLLCFVILGWSI